MTPRFDPRSSPADLPSSVPKAVVVQPPLLLSADFIDYPCFAGLGALQAAAVLRQAGLEVELMDGLCGEGAELVPLGEEAWLGEDRERFLERLDGLAEDDLVILAAPPFLLGHPGRRWLRELAARLAGRAGSWVLAELYVGGMHYLDTGPGAGTDQLTRDLAGDPLMLRFEGEPSLARLARTVARGGQIPAGEVWECTEPFALDDLPAPAWDLLDLEAYFARVQRVLGSTWRPGPLPPVPARTLPLVTARGCPYGCVFCTRNPGLEDRRAVRSVPLARVERWVEGWVEAYGLERLVILDEVANLDRRRFDGLLEIIARHGLAVEFPNGLRADRLTRDQLRRLRPLTSGLKVSLESASERVQEEVLGKKLDPAAVERVAGWCREEALPLSVHYLVGIPGESRSEMVATLEMAARLHEEYGVRALVQNAGPLPGTELARLCQQQDLLEEHRPEQLWASFQHRSLIRTEEFDGDLLTRARRVLQRRLAPPASAKVIVNLTYRCNNRCVFCAVGTLPAHDARLPDVLAALKRYRAEGYELLDIDGGEPTLHEDLLRVVAAARELGYQRVALITNGRRLSYAAYARGIARAGLAEVLVSLHAPEPKLNALLTGVEDSFAQTVAGIRNIISAMPDPGRQVAVNTTVVAANVESLAELARLLGELGVSRWNLQLVTPFGRADAELLPGQEQLHQQLSPILQNAPDRGMQVQLINCPPCLVPGHEEAAAADFGKAQRQMVFVGAAGENLGAFLAHKRVRSQRCEGCIHSLLCAGEYDFKA